MGKKQFSRKKLPEILEEEWALIDGLCILLVLFHNITTTLSGEKYSTLSIAFPVLCICKIYLMNKIEFDDPSGRRSKLNVKWVIYKSKYRDEPFFDCVVSDLTAAKALLLKLFRDRFKALHNAFLWTTCLDPRLRNGGLLKPRERIMVKDMHIRQACQITIVEDEKNKTTQSLAEDLVTMSSASKKNEDCLFPFSEMMNIDADCEAPATTEEIKTEVEHYLSNVGGVSDKTDPLVWWREHHSLYPRVAVLARKWLAAVSTSTPSERVFYDCRNTLTAKRNRLNDKEVQHQVMVKRNMPCLNVEPSELAKLCKR